ncbi:Glycosyltransferase involved in cell wall bisynthesis [Halorubrum aquaticum]|uniref:Glycosyltransferase involved in cell wall bisynthesis n=1 Tax=Halorubrum aquaticum TaxID=387340 RepID=A0A1I2ZM40_9EURY|nr:glycosyltransferase [Halorubrum aquaticum]SFH38898.1 Glycosyltransferase involved in cell wall bisynthesis [Halorubrum aquaticum]
MTDPDDDRITVLMCPDYRESNPYQSELIAALEARGVDVGATDAGWAFPLLAGVRRHGVPDVLHLHWLHRFVITERRFAAVFTVLLGVRLVFELVLLRALGVRIVWTVHNLLDHERVTPRSELAVRHAVARLVDRIVVHCEEAVESVEETYRLPERVVDRVRVVPHGNFLGVYENDVSQSTARERLELPPDVPVMAFFGLIRPYKNVPELIETFERVPGDARLLVVGNPWNEDVASRVRAASTGDDRVHTVLEYVPEDEIQVYMYAADAVVLPFDSVLTSGSAVLAMTFGRAVVAPLMGCLPGLIGSEGGYLYDPGDSAGLRTALRRAVDDREKLRGMGRRNRETVQAFDWDRVAERTRNVYTLDVGGAGHRSADSG